MSEGARLGAEAAALAVAPWSCPVCGATSSRVRFPTPSTGSESGVSADAFRPSSTAFGRAAAAVVTCTQCGHGSLDRYPAPSLVDDAYTAAADPISLEEEAGQVETGQRAMRRIEAITAPGRLADIGCWTGSLLVAASSRGWDVTGVEPSTWASARARARGLDVRTADLSNHGWAPSTFRAVAVCDVLEHLPDPGAAVDEAYRVLEPGGVLYVTVPDAGSALARAMGQRWWSVLPMHLQYFSRASMHRLLADRGFVVRSERTHAKVFSVRYYVSRLAAFSGRSLRSRSGRLVAPNFGDRLEVIATKVAPSQHGSPSRPPGRAGVHRPGL